MRAYHIEQEFIFVPDQWMYDSSLGGNEPGGNISAFIKNIRESHTTTLSGEILLQRWGTMKPNSATTPLQYDFKVMDDVKVPNTKGLM